MVQTNGKQEELRPSSNRRQQLQAEHVEGALPDVSNFLSIERYFDASDKVYASFQRFYVERNLDFAYVYGMRYSQYCINGIAKHDYFHSPKFSSRRLQMNERVTEVIGQLEEVANWMDKEEAEKQALQKAMEERLLEEKRKRERLKQEKLMSEFTKRFAQQKRSSSSDGAGQNVEDSALAKLQRLAHPQGIPQQEARPPHAASDPNRRVSWSLPAEPDGQLLSQISYDSGDLPPALLPPSDNIGVSSSHLSNGSAPPSYNSILKQSSYFGPGKAPAQATQPSAPPYDQAAKLSQKKPRSLPIRQLITQTRAKHDQFLRSRKIEVQPLQTYQGRISGSTNGCTVISACCVSKHMETYGGITNQQVTSVIDRDCVPLLRSIRNKLNLGAASLIIPSDVHDYLVDHKLLYQHKFAGAAGGNIVDPEHAGELIKLLQGEPGKTAHLKAAATLFFREHVVSIVKFPTADEPVFDMIDSLPTVNGRASRTRCHGLEAFKVHLAWYCTKKFSESNIKYMEKNKWDDMMADFDPRVFQAFVWADLPQPSSN